MCTGKPWGKELDLTSVVVWPWTPQRGGNERDCSTESGGCKCISIGTRGPEFSGNEYSFMLMPSGFIFIVGTWFELGFFLLFLCFL